MATSWISFGPDLEPLEADARRGVQVASRRRDGLGLTDAPEDVVAKLIEAAATTGGWCRLEQLREDGDRRPVFVNAAAVRFVAADNEPAD